MINRETIDRIGYEAAEISIPFEQFREGLASWYRYPVWVSGHLAGVIYYWQAEVHACILPEYRKRWFSRKIVNDLLQPIINTFGFLQTAVPDNKPWGHEFVTRFGFHKVGRRNSGTVYRLERMKWVSKQH